MLEWVPSQNGFFVDAPHRQSQTLLLVGKTFPFVSRSSIEPVTRYGPFGVARDLLVKGTDSDVANALSSHNVKIKSIIFRQNRQEMPVSTLS
jgi:hypothetical protein